MPDSVGSAHDSNKEGPGNANSIVAHNEHRPQRPARTAPAIGRFSLLEVLGEGGMGTVYTVYDARLDRRLALKLVRGASSDTAQRRMLREAQAMAKLSHPNVVPVFEVGEHEGQLYIAMELVAGVSLREWCERRPPWREVVAKYVQAGRGLHAAHAAGMIHRDFKPDNAIVGEDGRVRVLDFGLVASSETSTSEAVTDRNRDRSSHRLTVPGTVPGTPGYMAAEQFLGEPIDHRTDQFAFCVSLWEGLCGTRPFAGKTRYEIVDNVVAQRVDTPSTDVPPAVLRVLKRGLAVRPDDRWPDLPTLLAELRGVAVDRTRRRRLVGGLVASGGIALASAWGVARYRTHQENVAVAHCRDDAAQARAAMWNEAKSATVRDALLAVDVPYAEVTAQHVLPRIDEHAQEWERSAARACLLADVEQRWNDDLAARGRWCLEERELAIRGLVEQLTGADSGVITRAVVAVSNLDAASGCLDPNDLQRLPAPPNGDSREAATRVRRLIAKSDAAAAVGRFDDALDDAHTALEEASTIAYPGLLAAARVTLGRRHDAVGDFKSAEQTLTDAYFEAAGASTIPTAVGAASTLVSVVGSRLSRHAEGRNWARLAKLGLDQLDAQPDAPLRTALDARLSKLETSAGQHDKALVLAQRAVAQHEIRFGPQHPTTISSLNRVGGVQYNMGAFHEASETFEQVLRGQRAQLSAQHPDVAQTLGNLALVDTALARYDQAAEHYAEALAIQREVLGPRHPIVADTTTNFGALLATVGKLDQAREQFEQALRLREDTLEPTDPSLGASHNNLAIVFGALGDLERSEHHYVRALEIQEAALGPDHPDLAKSIGNLAALRHERGDSKGAEALHLRSLKIRRRALGPENPSVASSLHNLAIVYAATERPKLAIETFEQAAQIRSSALGKDHPLVGVSLTGIGDAQIELRRWTSAHETFEEAVRIYEEHEGEQPGEDDAYFGLARTVLKNEGDSARAREHAVRALEIYRGQGEVRADRAAIVEAWLSENPAPN